MALVANDREGAWAVEAAPGFFERLRVVSTTRAFWRAHGLSRDAAAEGLRAVLGMADGRGGIVYADQVHGARVGAADSEEPVRSGRGWRMLNACDAVWTRRRDTAVVARSADCVPVVVACERTPWIAAVHAGWRGTFEGAVVETIAAAVACGVDAAALRVWIGPCISGDVYEVSEKLADSFSARFAEFSGFRNGRLLDLGALNRLQALRAGVQAENVLVSGQCTLSNPDVFPSFRRDGECRGQIYTAAVLRSEP